MDKNLKEHITSLCRNLDIPLVGFAPADRWDTPPFEPWVPEEFRPTSIFPETKTVIVIGLPVSLPVIETAPSIHYHELYRTVNAMLDMYGYRIAESLSARGWPSVWIPRDGYGSIGVLRERPVAFFSHRHAAYLAGLGTFGINNMLLTPEFGPRARFASIFTSAEISDPAGIMHKDLCIRCMRCVEACPVNALTERDYPEGLTDKKTCSARSEALANRYISPCGLCIRVCPVGEDRQRYNRLDAGMYDEGNETFAPYHRAWKHVRSYGGR